MPPYEQRGAQEVRPTYSRGILSLLVTSCFRPILIKFTFKGPLRILP